MQRIKSKLEFETEIYNDKTAKIAERLVTKYTGNAVVRAGEETVMKDKVAVKQAWLVIYTVDEQQFQDFLHAEFLKLIPVLEVVREGELNILSWPLDDSDIVLKTIEAMDAMPTI
jgi:hypothetical protein